MSEQPEMFSAPEQAKSGGNKGIVALMVVAAVLVVESALDGGS
jgi:hypothetical protein